MKHIVMYSGGVVSWLTARRVAERHGTAEMALLFADTRMEDEDLYRFLRESAANVGGQLVEVADGRNIWQVFRERRFLGNTRVDLCSRILKRELLRRWLDEHCDPAATTVHLGYGWLEYDRWEKAQGYWAPWTVSAPLCEPPYGDKLDALAELATAGLAAPRLYGMGFEHNNCGGGCVKAGQAQFERLLRALPERFAEWEREEGELAEYLGKNVSILRDRRGGRTRPLTLRNFRERLEVQPELFDADDWGGACDCFTPPMAAA